MAVDLLRAFSAKRVEIVLLGDRVTPDRAYEIIRRTDLLFRHLKYFPVSDAGQALRKRLGFPDAVDFAAAAIPRDALKHAIADWRNQWSSLDLEWLVNRTLLDGTGWCHGNGTLAFADELEDYPTGEELFNDCRRLVNAFPDLALDIAAWGHGPTMLGYPMLDAPPGQWSAEQIDLVAPPTLGFMLHQGHVAAVSGNDPRLFQRYGLNYGQAVETSLREALRRATATITAGLEEIDPASRVPENVLKDWVERARTLGLIA